MLIRANQAKIIHKVYQPSSSVLLWVEYFFFFLFLKANGKKKD